MWECWAQNFPLTTGITDTFTPLHPFRILFRPQNSFVPINDYQNFGNTSTLAWSNYKSSRIHLTPVHLQFVQLSAQIILVFLSARRCHLSSIFQSSLTSPPPPPATARAYTMLPASHPSLPVLLSHSNNLTHRNKLCNKTFFVLSAPLLGPRLTRTETWQYWQCQRLEWGQYIWPDSGGSFISWVQQPDKASLLSSGTTCLGCCWTRSFRPPWYGQQSIMPGVVTNGNQFINYNAAGWMMRAHTNKIKGRLG